MSIAMSLRGALTLPHHFAELRKNIEPPQHRKAVASSIPHDVRRFLEESSDFPTQEPHSRLTGSYRRSTAIHSIKDVDFVVFVDPDNTDPDPESVLDSLYWTLRGLPAALGYIGDAQVLRRQRRSVHVAFADQDFHLDVVPTLIPRGIDRPLLVPDKGWGTWVESDPLGYVGALSDLNSATSEKAVPLIKMIKHWRTVQMQRQRPKSYYLEALIYKHLTDGSVTILDKSDAELFTDLLRAIHDAFRPTLDGGGVPTIPDPMLGHDVAFNWERPAFERFMRRAEESISWAERALAKGRDELDEAVALWQNVFGSECFVDSAEARRLQDAEWLASGSVFVTAAGRVLGERPAGERAVASPRHRFYGREE